MFLLTICHRTVTQFPKYLQLSLRSKLKIEIEKHELEHEQRPAASLTLGRVAVTRDTPVLGYILRGRFLRNTESFPNIWEDSSITQRVRLLKGDSLITQGVSPIREYTLWASIEVLGILGQ